MKESKVLIIGLTNCCTELARHLTLSGCNLNFLTFDFEGSAESQVVGPDDFMNDFLFSAEDAG